MYVTQRFSRVLRPGKASDALPYGKPGVWSTIAYNATLDDAQDGLTRVMLDNPRSITMYRILNPDGSEA